MQPKKHQGLLGWPFWTYSLAHCWRTAHKLPSLGCLFSFLSVFPANTPSSFGSLSTLCICIYPSESYQSIYPVSLLSNIYTPLAFFSLAFFSLPRVVQQRHLSVQRNADFVVCCQPAIIGKLGPLFFLPRKTFIPHTFWKAQLKDLMLACVMPAWRRTYIHIEIRCAYSYTRILNSRTCNNCTMIHVTNSIH